MKLEALNKCILVKPIEFKQESIITMPGNKKQLVRTAIVQGVPADYSQDVSVGDTVYFQSTDLIEIEKDVSVIRLEDLICKLSKTE